MRKKNGYKRKIKEILKERLRKESINQRNIKEGINKSKKDLGRKTFTQELH